MGAEERDTHGAYVYSEKTLTIYQNTRENKDIGGTCYAKAATFNYALLGQPVFL